MPTIPDDLWNTVNIIGFDASLHAAFYRYRKAWAEARWENPAQPRSGLRLWYAFRRKLKRDRPRWPVAWEHPGRVRYVTPTDRGAIVATDHCTLEIAFLAADLIRVRYRPYALEHVPEPVPYAIAKPIDEWPVPATTLIQTEKTLFVRSEALTVGIALDDAQVFIADAEGQLLRTDLDAGWSAQGALRHRTTLTDDEHIFGLGERATAHNRRGRTHILWNTDPAGYTDGDDPINLNIPVYVETPRWGASTLTFYENPYYAEFDLGDTTPNVADHRFAGGELRYYFATGTTPHLIERYTELTGRHDIPPLWMLGYQQSRWSYYPESRVRKLAHDFREHDVPCDAIHLDIHYLDGYRCFTVDKTRFPNLPQLAADLRQQGIKLITILDPGIKKDPQYPVYQEGLANNHFCKTPDHAPLGSGVYHAPVWPGLSAFPDFTAPRTRLWWGKLYKPLVEAGIEGFWNDMNEPAAFSQPQPGSLPDPVRHSLEGRGGDHREAHNLYGMQMARAGHDGLRALQPDKRPVLITRSGWAGVQRYATSWTGDNESTWASLRLTVPMMLNLGLSGIGFTGSDVGGFAGEADGELYTRWIQMAAFVPFFRAHTISGAPDQEPWSYGEPYLSIVRRFIQLRYELLPYLYTAVWQMAERGWPVVRPLWWDHPHAGELLDIDDAFLCGDALLIAPVGEPGATSRPVTLPPGAWYNFWTNELHSVPSVQSVETFAPLETVPLFVRAGTVLPMGEYAPSVERRVQKFLRLSVYPLTDAGESISELYEDDGESFDYRQGDYRLNRFTLRQTGAELTLTWTREGRYEPPYEHVELTLNGLTRAPRTVVVDGETYAVAATDPVRRTAVLGVPPFKTLEVTL